MHRLPESFWNNAGDLYLKCEYRLWDQQIAHIDAVPTPKAKAAGIKGWTWTSDSEGRTVWLLEAVLGLTGMVVSVVLFRKRKVLPRVSESRAVTQFPNRWAVRIYGSVVLLLVCWCVFVRVYDRWFQWKAESLLHEMQNLEVRKSTWSDAERIRARFARNAGSNGAFTPVRCDLEISLVHWDIFSRLGENFSWIDPAEMKAVELAGGRWGRVDAILRIRAGVVWGKDFTTRMLYPEDYELIAEANTISHFANPSYRADVKHPNLSFGRPGGCEGCKALWAKVTPFASADEFHDAFAFDLSCLASTLRRCTEMDQIMPVAARRVADWSWAEAVGTYQWAPQVSLKYFGRDIPQIAILEPINVHSPKMDKSGTAVQTIDYRVIKILKGKFESDVLAANYYTGSPYAVNPANGSPPKLSQQLLAFWDASEWAPMIAPLTDQNLRETLNGIAEDVPDIPSSSH